MNGFTTFIKETSGKKLGLLGCFSIFIIFGIIGAFIPKQAENSPKEDNNSANVNTTSSQSEKTVTVAGVTTQQTISAQTTQVSTTVTQTTTKAETQQPVIEKSAKDILDEYDANTLSADQKYIGKVIRVTGKVSAITEGLFGGYYVSLNSEEMFDFRSVHCEGKKEQFMNLAKDNIIKVEGKVKDYSFTILKLENCKVL